MTSLKVNTSRLKTRCHLPFRWPRSLRSQLIASVWLGMAVIVVPFNIYTLHKERSYASNQEFRTLQDHSTTTQFILTRWADNLNRLVKALSVIPVVRSLDKSRNQIFLGRLSSIYPHRKFSIYDAQGRLIAGTSLGNAESLISFARNQDWSRRDDNPFDELQVSANCTDGVPCLSLIAPIMPSLGLAKRPSGFAIISIPLNETQDDLSLSDNHELLNVSIHGSRKKCNTLSPQHGDTSGCEIFALNNKGLILFPFTNINDELSLQSPQELKKGAWGEIIVQSSPSPNSRSSSLREVSANGTDYLVYASSLGKNWRIVALSDKQTILSGITGRMVGLMVNQLILLAAISLMIALICGRAANTVLVAAERVKKLSRLELNEPLPEDRDDEVGSLYRNINQTGINLLQLMNEKLEHAVTDKQLQTAALIQQEFLVHNRLSNNNVSIAAIFDPAYQIGADWYDVLHHDDITYIVVADVCDKGIPSALFMSVFRSLLRYSLNRQDKDRQDDSLQMRLSQTAMCVNDYMATNHGDSAMFATVFLAAYSVADQQLFYVCAGHEKPCILRASGALDMLEPTGPAIGIFSGARYGIGTVPFDSGDLLFAYSDGLVDARSAQGESFGIQRVKDLLAAPGKTQQSVEAILATMVEAVTDHTLNAEQFDDMTILVMKAL